MIQQTDFFAIRHINYNDVIDIINAGSPKED